MHAEHPRAISHATPTHDQRFESLGKPGIYPLTVLSPRYIGRQNNMAEFYGSGKEFGSYDSQVKMSFKAFEIAPVIERIVTTSADKPKTVG